MFGTKFVRVLLQITFCINASYSVKEVILTDTCNGENFHPTCSVSGETVLMISAIYGRPKIGKCISQKEVSGVLGQDIKYFGCSSDVSKILHEKCSLKNVCSIKLPDSDLDKTEPCFPGLKLYLHTEHKCIKIITNEQDCRIQVYSASRYLTTSTIFTITNCGRPNNPWIMEAPRGQKIKLIIEILDESQNNAMSGITCGEEFGTVFEKSHGIRKNVTLCTNGVEVVGDQHKREKNNIWTSSGSLLELTFNSEFIKSHEKSSNQPIILLKIESDGCLDIIPPEDTWLKRTGDDIVIGCYSSKQTWYLRCEDKKWAGTIGNCSINKRPVAHEKDLLTNIPHTPEISEEQQIVLFVAICALGLVICLIIVCVGAICVKKYKWKTAGDGIYNKSPAYYHNGEGIVDGQLLDSHYKSISKNKNQNNCELFDQKNVEKPEDNKYFILEDNCN